MSLAQGRPYLAIPGPSVMPDRVLRAMHRAAPNIYVGELIDMVAGMIPDLAAVARTRHQTAIYIGNGHAAWEAAAANVLAPGDTALVLCTGRFGHGWADMIEALGVTVERMDYGRRSPADVSRLAERLAEDKDHRIKAVATVQVDTATSVLNDVPAIRAALDEAGHPALLMVDTIASLACDRYEMDAWGVDITVAACQKGLMTPPGVAFVYFNDKAAEVRRAMPRVSSYWDWIPRADPEIFSNYFCGTAPTHHLYGLREALDMLVREEGMEAAWARHDRLARAIWAAIEAWGAGGPMEANIADPACRSRAVTSVRIGAPHGKRLQDWLPENAGVTLGIGLGMATEDDPKSTGFFRIGHMGHVNAHMVLGMLGTVEAGLRALEIPFGDGALAAASRVVAEG